ATPPAGADSTVRLQFVDDDISQRDALDELGLPSRWRAVVVLAAVALLAVGVGLGVSRFRGGRGDHPAAAHGDATAVRAPGEVVHNPAPMPTAPSPQASPAAPPPTASLAHETSAPLPDVELPPAGAATAIAPVAAAAAPAGVASAEPSARSP